jgi:hypothetical protein
MVLIIALNAVLAAGVIAMVLSPLLWAIFTQHRHHVALAPATAFGPKTVTSGQIPVRVRRARFAVA